MRYDLSLDIMQADRAWHNLEQQLASDAKKAGTPEERFIDIVDVDVLPGTDKRPVFADRDEVRTAYEGFLSDPRLPDTSEFTRRKLLAQLVQLDLLEGGTSDVFHQVEVAMGSELKLVDEQELDRRQETLEEQLGKNDLGFDESYAEAFYERLGVKKGKKEMRRHLIAFAHHTGALAINENPKDSLAIPKIVSVDAGWVGYFSTDETGKPFTQLNAHDRHNYTRGRAAAVAAHEGMGHAADFAHKREAILRGEMDPLFGLTNVFTPDNVTAEMIAQAREQQSLRSVRGEDAWEYHFQADYHDYVEMVYNNALIYINDGWDETKTMQYLRSRLLPYEKAESIEGRLRDMRDDPGLRANSASYEPAMRVVRRVLELTPAEQETFLGEVVNYPYNEAQMHSILDGDKPSLAVT